MAMSMREILSAPGKDRNFALIVENQKLWVSKEVLAMFSPVFRSMFYGDFKEAKENSTELPGKRLDDIVEMLACLLTYTKQKCVDFDNVETLIKLADEYDIENLKIRCAPVLINKLKHNEEVMSDLKIMVQYKYKDAVRACIPYVARSLSVKQIMQKHNEFPDSVIGSLLEAKLNRLENEKHDRRKTAFCFNCDLCDISTKSYKCDKCKSSLCEKCIVKKSCSSFHKSVCPVRYDAATSEECECGYEFSDSWLTNVNNL